VQLDGLADGELFRGGHDADEGRGRIGEEPVELRESSAIGPRRASAPSVRGAARSGSSDRTPARRPDELVHRTAEAPRLDPAEDALEDEDSVSRARRPRAPGTTCSRSRRASTRKRSTPRRNRRAPARARWPRRRARRDARRLRAEAFGAEERAEPSAAHLDGEHAPPGIGGGARASAAATVVFPTPPFP
jgi:hypothetical protein